MARSSLSPAAAAGSAAVESGSAQPLPRDDCPRDGGTAIGEALTARILSAVAARVVGLRTRPGAAAEPLPDTVSRLVAAVSGVDPADQQALRAHFEALGISDEDLVDIYVPAAARRLGEEWLSDDRSFADVTIASARLQAMLRDLSADWRADDMPGDTAGRGLQPLPARTSAGVADSAPNILMVVRQDDQHTLGTMVAACQFRRMGVSVRLMLGQSDAAVFAMAQSKCYDMLTIALSSEDRVESVRKLVKTLKSSPVPVPPIVVGGPMLAMHPDLKGETGADHVSSDTAEALALCGLRARADRALRLKVQV